jgi:pseudouridine kinase
MVEHVLVIGAALLDTKGKPVEGLEPGTSNPARIQHTRGGTARNVAENLARLGADINLISAVGNDRTGRRLLDETADSGVNIDKVLVIEGVNSGSYIAILDGDGSLAVALDDVGVMESITPKYLYQNRKLFRDAAVIMIDGSLGQAAMDTAVRLADQFHKPLVADPSSSRLASNLRPFLPQLHLVVPNESEAASLLGLDFTGYDPDASLDAALRLSQAGVRIAVVTLSDYGLVFATSEETGYIPARYSEMIDSTGTGDAVTAAIIFGMLNDLAPIESIRLGAAAASLTLQSSDTVVPDLSLDMLYSHLIV